MSYFKTGFTIVQNLYRLTIVAHPYHNCETENWNGRNKKTSAILRYSQRSGRIILI